LTTNWIDITEAQAILFRSAEWIENRMLPADFTPEFPINRSWFFFENTDWIEKDGQFYFNRDKIQSMRKEVLELTKKTYF
jgi:hypothetical protein